MKHSTLTVLAVSAMLATTAFAQQTTLRVYISTQNRPDLMRKLFDEFQKTRPGVKVEIEARGATSELQRQYLSTVLAAKDANLDIFMIDIVNPAQYYSAGWIEPLDTYVASPVDALKNHLPVYSASNVVNGKLVALPAFADAQFLYYRKDLLTKYKIREPKTWDDVAAAAKIIGDGEKTPNLQGLSIQGAPIEGAVCTFLTPYWSRGRNITSPSGRLDFDKSVAVDGLKYGMSLVDKGVVPQNLAQVTTGDTINAFKAGNAMFAVNWGFAWDRFKDDADSQVKGKVAVASMPAMPGGKSATCVGGWQWAVSAFSKNKPASADLIRFMSSPIASKYLAIEGSLLPTYAGIYTDSDVTRQVPWFLGAGLAMAFGKSRPMNARYAEVSDAIRTNTSAVLARTKTPEAGVDDIDAKLQRVMR